LKYEDVNEKQPRVAPVNGGKTRDRNQRHPAEGEIVDEEGKALV